MAESAQCTRTRPWRRALITTVVIVASAAATSALAATVTSAPTISGTLESGSQLSASAGSWTPSSATPTYDWLRCDAAGLNCEGISGACGRRYTVRTADETHTLKVRLTATESNGDAASADSKPTEVVQPKPYRPTVGPSDTCTVVKPTGSGQGTFTSGTQTGAGSQPLPQTALQFIDPFPVVRIAGRFKGKRTTFTRVSITTPHHTRIAIKCKGRGCPYTHKAAAVRLLRVRSLQRAYRPKATIEIRVTQPQRIGKYTRISTRRGKAPLRVDRCLMPDQTRPVTCPTG